MKLTLDNFKDYVNKKDQNLVGALILDVNELNMKLDTVKMSNRKVFIDFIDKHTEYSPERTDPCPDFYGMYRLLFEEKPYEPIGTEMTVNELDIVLCALINFVE